MTLQLKSNVAFCGDTASLPPFLLADLYKTMFVAYSTRRLSSAYSGAALRVRRSSDSAEQDIGFTSSYELDTAALTTFVGAGDGFVTTLYDQSGGGRNAVQATATAQPKIVSGGAVTISSGKPSLLFDGTSDFFDMIQAAGAFKASPRTQWIASMRSTKTSGTESVFASSASNASVSLLFNVDMIITAPRSFRTVSRRLSTDAGGAVTSSAGHGNAQVVLTGDVNWLEGVSNIRQDGVQTGTGLLATSGNTVSGNSLVMRFGSDLSGSTWFGGYLSELVIFNNSGAELVAGVEANMMARAGI